MAMVGRSVGVGKTKVHILAGIHDERGDVMRCDEVLYRCRYEVYIYMSARLTLAESITHTTFLSSVSLSSPRPSTNLSGTPCSFAAFSTAANAGPAVPPVGGKRRGSRWGGCWYSWTTEAACRPDRSISAAPRRTAHLGGR